MRLLCLSVNTINKPPYWRQMPPASFVLTEVVRVTCVASYRYRFDQRGTWLGFMASFWQHQLWPHREEEKRHCQAQLKDSGQTRSLRLSQESISSHFLFQAQRQRIHSYTLQCPLVLITCHCLSTELSAGNNTSLPVVSVFPFAIILWLVTALPEDHEGEWVRFGSPSPKGRDGSWTTVKGSLSVSTKTVAMPWNPSFLWWWVSHQYLLQVSFQSGLIVVVWWDGCIDSWPEANPIDSILWFLLVTRTPLPQ